MRNNQRRQPSPNSPNFPFGWKTSSRLLPASVAYPIATLAVLLISWLIYTIESSFTSQAPRIFGMEYLIAIALVTLVAGRWPGLYALLLSIIMLVSMLAYPSFTWRFDQSADLAELVLLCLIGGMVVVALDSAQRAEQRERLRADHESLIVHIGQAVRASADPDAVSAFALEALGNAFAADFCHLAAYGGDGGVRAEIQRIWYREGPPLESANYGTWDAAVDLEMLFNAHAPLVLDDVHTSPLPDAARDILAASMIRSLVSVPLFAEGRLATTLTVGMMDTPRRWTAEEVALVEAVASQTRSAMEVARAAARERNIASRLQDALQPGLPNPVPGLDLAEYYTAALDESRVGGDFFDVFSVEKGMYALVVGDLSGKGLQAAVQIATVRNMLRYALYQRIPLAKSLEELNRTIVQNNVLTGFATLFVALYDPAARNLIYASCGHEPALIWRGASGLVEHLPPTGPVLGLSETARFRTHLVRMATGDAFAIFTDGLSEAGPNRNALLGIDGVAKGFMAAAYLVPASAVISELMGYVKEYANGTLRDDVCVLVGIIN